MKGAPPFVDLLFNLCPICVIAIPLISIGIMITLMNKSKGTAATLTDIPPNEEKE